MLDQNRGYRSRSGPSMNQQLRFRDQDSLQLDWKPKHIRQLLYQRMRNTEELKLLMKNMGQKKKNKAVLLH